MTPLIYVSFNSRTGNFALGSSGKPLMEFSPTLIKALGPEEFVEIAGAKPNGRPIKSYRRPFHFEVGSQLLVADLRYYDGHARENVFAVLPTYQSTQVVPVVVKGAHPPFFIPYMTSPTRSEPSLN